MNIGRSNGIKVAMALLAIAGLGSSRVVSQEKPASAVVMAKLLVTAEVDKDKKAPEIKLSDVAVKVGKERVPVKHWEAATGQYGGLALFILIDDVLDPSTGGLFGDIRDFIKAQPATTLIGVGYMRNAGVTVAQDLTNDHEAAAKAVRLPTGSSGSANPYLSLNSLIKKWPDHGGRKEVLMITDGIDRLRPRSSRMDLMAPSSDVSTASTAAQKAGVLVYSFYATSVGHMVRTNSAAASGGQSGLAKLSEETGGDSYFMGYSNPVSFKPYLEDLQKCLDNQYWLAIDIMPGSKPSLKRVDVSTEVPGVELITADSIFVPAAK